MSDAQWFRVFAIATDKLTMHAKSLLDVNWQLTVCPCGLWNPSSRTNILCLLTSLCNAPLYRALAIAPDKITMLAKSPLNLNWQLSICPYGWWKLSPRTKGMSLLSALINMQWFRAHSILTRNTELKCLQSHCSRWTGNCNLPLWMAMLKCRGRTGESGKEEIPPEEEGEGGNEGLLEKAGYRN